MGSFENRLRLQKVIYIIQQMGVNLGYSFSYYHYGPYSPDLTKDAYQINNISKIKTVGFEDVAVEDQFKNILDKLKPHKNDSFWLEVAASIHLLKKEVFSKTASKSQIIQAIVNKRLEFNKQSDEIKRVWAEIDGWLI